MANNLFISYDLYNPGKDYASVIEAIKGLGSWAKVHKSVWYVNSSLTSEQAANKIWAQMDANDSLIVIDASNNNAHWYNVAEAATKHMQDQWHK